MHRHAPANYRCPFCRNITAGEADHPLEIVHRDEDVFVKVNPRWRPNNPGAVLVVPVEHYENLYELPDRLGTPLQSAIRRTALAMKTAFGCPGISTRQHNEPAGDQDVWHYHVHVVPRWKDDAFYDTQGTWADPDELRQRASLLRDAWQSPSLDSDLSQPRR
jgi:histidine triad (HIT) family protein